MLPLRLGVVVVLVLLLLLVVVMVVVMVVGDLRLPLHLLLNLMVRNRWGWLTLLGLCFRLVWSLVPTCC